MINRKYEYLISMKDIRNIAADVFPRMKSHIEVAYVRSKRIVTPGSENMPKKTRRIT